MKPISISEARTRLPELARHVTAHAGAVVVIHNRRMGEAVALTSARYLEYLETQLSELKKSGAAFLLKGSLTSDLSDADLELAFVRMRSEQAARDLARRESLAQ